MTQSTVSAGSNPLSHRGLLTIWAALHRVVGHETDLVHLQVSVCKLTSFFCIYAIIWGEFTRFAHLGTMSNGVTLRPLTSV